MKKMRHILLLVVSTLGMLFSNAQTNPCPTCTISTTLWANPNLITLNPGTTTTINCNKSYDISRSISCTPNTITNANVQVYLQNAIGQTPAWVNMPSLTNNIFNIPAGVSGTFYLKYVWSNTIGICGSVIYPLNIVCSPPCQPNCTFTGTISGLTAPGSNTNIQCGATYNVQCNKNYQGGVLLNCTSPNSNTLLTGIFKNQSSQIIAPLWSNGYFNFPNPGTYTATYYKTNATGNCGSCILTFNVTCPLCNFLSVALQNQTICKGASTTLGIAPEAGISYSWTSSPASTLPATSTITVSPTVTTTYTLSRTNSNPNCPAKISTVTVTVAPCCDPTCSMGLTVKNMVTSQTTVWNSNTTIQFNCGQDYFFTRSLNCSPANPNIIFKQVNVANSLSQPVSWASNFILAGANGTLSIPASAIPGIYTITYTFGTSSQVCKSVNYTFEIICGCNCQSTQCTKKLWYKDLSTGTITKIACDIKTSIDLNCNINYHFFAATTCSPNANCNMIVKGEFRNAAGDLVIQQTPFSNSSAFNIISSIPGNYTFIIKYYINGIECSQCNIPIVVKDCCNCQSTQCTKNLWYKDLGTGTITNFTCNPQTSIDLNCNINYNFFVATTCSPNANCKMVVKGEFRNAAGALVIQQTPFSNSSAFNIISGTPGNYTFIIKYYINDIECSQCTIPIKVSCN